MAGGARRQLPPRQPVESGPGAASTERCRQVRGDTRPAEGSTACGDHDPRRCIGAQVDGVLQSQSVCIVHLNIVAGAENVQLFAAARNREAESRADVEFLLADQLVACQIELPKFAAAISALSVERD